MKVISLRVVPLVLTLFVSGLFAQTGAGISNPKKVHRQTRTAKVQRPSVESQIEALKDEMQEQRSEINSLKQQLSTRDEQLREAQSSANAAQSVAVKAQRAVDQQQQAMTENTNSVNTLRGTVDDMRTNTSSIVGTLQDVETHAAKKSELSDLALSKVKIGVTFFGDWSYYNSTGYGQQWMDTPTEQLPPGNDGFNTFEVNRAYVNFNYTPNERVTLRITPDIYRNSDGSYVLRLKYGYADIQKIFGHGAFKNDKITFGQTQQPLTDWEEGLSGHRYTYLTPWNYLSLSSTYDGVKIHGPIEANGKEYFDYDLGIFNTASFHAVETDENKQIMVRGTVYPFGTKSDRTGLGITFFNDYGYKTVLPSAKQTSLDRLATVVSYQTHDKGSQIAFEYDWGHNAYGTSNLFNGAGSPTGTYAAFGTEAGTILSGSTHQQGYDVFGHLRLGKSKFSLWGLFQYFQPNTDFDYKAAGFTANPIDFDRTIGGLAYAVTKQFDIAIGDENFHWVHPQRFVTGGDTNAIVVWSQFNF